MIGLMHRSIADALGAAHDWGAEHVGLALVGQVGVIDAVGDTQREFEWASVTKLATSVAVLRSVEQGRVSLDEPLGPPGATIRHLLAHASGLGPEGTVPISAPERTRIYSNVGFDVLGERLAELAGRSIAEVLEADVLGPLGMRGTRLVGRASAGMVGWLVDLAKLGQELLRPTLLQSATLATAVTVAFPGLAGVLPGLGRYDPLDWGLGFELKDAKAGHWSGSRTSPQAFGHFGGSGTFLWVDPEPGIACVCLTDREFGDWALDAWPRLCDAVLDESSGFLSEA